MMHLLQSSNRVALSFCNRPMGALLAADPDTTTFKDFLLVVQSPATWSTAVILAIIVSFLRTLYVQRKQALLKLRKG